MSFYICLLNIYIKKLYIYIIFYVGHFFSVFTEFCYNSASVFCFVGCVA